MFQIKHVTPPASNGMDAGTLIGVSRMPTAVAKQLGSNSREDSAVAFDVLRAQTVFAAWDSARVQIGQVLRSLTSKDDLPASSLWNWANCDCKARPRGTTLPISLPFLGYVTAPSSNKLGLI